MRLDRGAAHAAGTLPRRRTEAAHARDEHRTGLAARIARRLYRWRYRLLQARRYGVVDLAQVGGMRLFVLPGVFHPEFFFASAFFVRYLQDRPLRPGICVLDMGTGSGALAVALARRGIRVTAVDINPEAVRCARANLILHGLEDRVEVLEGDLFAPLTGRRFDLIVFHPPFYARPARDFADGAWAAGTDSDTIRRFCREAPAHLNADSEMVLMGSTEAPYTRELRRLPGYRVREVAHRELLSERLFLFSMTPETRSVSEGATHSALWSFPAR